MSEAGEKGSRSLAISPSFKASTLVFVLMYGASLLGWVQPLDDEKVVSRLGPISSVIIGYYFGRLPSQQNEKTLHGEITRQAQKLNAAQHAKEQALQARESLEEKLKTSGHLWYPGRRVWG